MFHSRQQSTNRNFTLFINFSMKIVFLSTAAYFNHFTRNSKWFHVTNFFRQRIQSVQIVCNLFSEASVKQVHNNFRSFLSKCGFGREINGILCKREAKMMAVPEKLNHCEQHEIVLLHPNRQQILRLIREISSNYYYRRQPVAVLV